MSKILMLFVAMFGLSAAAHAAEPAPVNPAAANPYLKNVPPPEPMMTMPKGTGSLKNAVPWQM